MNFLNRERAEIIVAAIIQMFIMLSVSAVGGILLATSHTPNAIAIVESLVLLLIGIFMFVFVLVPLNAMQKSLTIFLSLLGLTVFIYSVMKLIIEPFRVQIHFTSQDAIGRSLAFSFVFVLIFSMIAFFSYFAPFVLTGISRIWSRVRSWPRRGV